MHSPLFFFAVVCRPAQPTWTGNARSRRSRQIEEPLARRWVRAAADRRSRDGQACLAGLYLLYDCLDESHTISQSIETPTGGYWHGIMHRREPDYGNAKYWFRRVGDHPVYAPLAIAARELASAERPDPAAEFLIEQAAWDPFRFVDLSAAAQASSATCFAARFNAASATCSSITASARPPAGDDSSDQQLPRGLDYDGDDVHSALLLGRRRDQSLVCSFFMGLVPPPIRLPLQGLKPQNESPVNGAQNTCLVSSGIPRRKRLGNLNIADKVNKKPYLQERHAKRIPNPCRERPSAFTVASMEGTAGSPLWRFLLPVPRQPGAARAAEQQAGGCGRPPERRPLTIPSSVWSTSNPWRAASSRPARIHGPVHGHDSRHRSRIRDVPIPGGKFTMGSPDRRRVASPPRDRNSRSKSSRSGWASAKSPGPSAASS